MIVTLQKLFESVAPDCSLTWLYSDIDRGNLFPVQAPSTPSCRGKSGCRSEDYPTVAISSTFLYDTFTLSSSLQKTIKYYEYRSGYSPRALPDEGWGVLLQLYWVCEYKRPLDSMQGNLSRFWMAIRRIFLSSFLFGFPEISDLRQFVLSAFMT